MPITVTETDAPNSRRLDWESLAVPGSGKPDLQFSGKNLFAIEQRTDGELHASICLMERKKGGFALAWAAFTNDRLLRHAVVLSSLSDVMDHLEDSCVPRNDPATVGQNDMPPSQNGLLSYISELQRITNF